VGNDPCKAAMSTFLNGRITDYVYLLLGMERVVQGVGGAKFSKASEQRFLPWLERDSELLL